MVETRDLAQLRQLNLELLRQLWVGQDAVRRSVAKAASESSLGSSGSYDSEMPSSPEASSVASRACCPQDAHQGDPCGRDGASSGAVSLPPAGCLHPESPDPLRPRSAPLLATSGLSDPELSAQLDSLDTQEARALKSILAQRSKLSEGLWTTALPSPASPRPSSRSCRSSGKPTRRSVFAVTPSVYCYRVNRRLFLVPSDPGTPCRLCRTPRDQRGPETLAEPAQVRVSIPLSVLDPPHRYRIHRRKSFDASDTLALPRHCLLGWDILPPKSEKSSAPKSLDLWSSVSSEAQRRKLSAASLSHRAVPTRVPAPTPIWSELSVPQPHAPRPKP
ncbi:migration and invasion-inhibitory protein isoform X4 [Balaenoptera musculus]|uniref:Migration and invasion-inhibitory protein isoform X4 n=1 Tax=Balaenoptera musculus TaxID=9771 RepID=A0A8B8VUL2_BALMU|nr:migration and invasion-inhibitory protein isoform X4 [Balaenoptera musculus]